jgi:uroporphyrinogen decarboxylase
MKRIDLFVISLCLLCTACQQPKKESSTQLTKREIMQNLLNGKKQDNYVPAVFFMHFPASIGRDAVYYHIRHLAAADMDLLKVQFEQHQPNIRMETATDWEQIKPLPRDFYAPTVSVVKEVVDIVGHNTMVLATIYSPFQVLRSQIGIPAVIRWAKEDPDKVLRALNIYKDALLNFADDCKAAGVDGFFTPTQGGEVTYNEIPDFYEKFIRPFDLEVMTACNTGTQCNILHICDWEGPYDDLARFASYPGQIVNAPNIVAGQPFTPADAEKMFNRIALGGLERRGAINKGTPDEVTAAVKQVIRDNPGRLIIGAECTIDGRTPIENIRAAVRAAHGK